MLSQSGAALTWDHLDGGVHLPPVLGALELPVQDEVAVVRDDGPLREQHRRQPASPNAAAGHKLRPPPTALLTAMRRLATPPKRRTMVLQTGT